MNCNYDKNLIELHIDIFPTILEWSKFDLIAWAMGKKKRPPFLRALELKPFMKEVLDFEYQSLSQTR